MSISYTERKNCMYMYKEGVRNIDYRTVQQLRLLLEQCVFGHSLQFFYLHKELLGPFLTVTVSCKQEA